MALYIQSDSLDLKDLSERVSRLEGAVSGYIEATQSHQEIVTRQMETIGHNVDTSMATINMSLLLYTAAIAVIGFILGWIGYRSVMSRIEQTVDQEVADHIGDRIDARIEQAMTRWDTKFAELYERMNKLAGSRTRGPGDD